MSRTVSKSPVSSERIEKMIFFIKGKKVILDQDLALLYGVSTGNFNKAVKRNIERFPEDFAFFLTKEEWNALMFQIGISKSGRGGRRKLPMVFTEHGVVMAAKNSGNSNLSFSNILKNQIRNSAKCGRPLKS
jgi:hypothetical protein